MIRYMDQPVLSQVQMRWLRLGLFQSIPPLLKYHSGKANIVADALSQSQRSAAAESDQAEEAIAQDEVLLLSGRSVEL